MTREGERSSDVPARLTRRCIGPTRSTAIPLFIVAHGSKADKPSLAKIQQRPLLPNSRQNIAVRSALKR
jgi:hypothetical protein